MPFVKSILCSVICVLFFPTLGAQLSSNKGPINNVVNENFYSGKWWSVEQILKDSVSYHYTSIHDQCCLLTSSRSSVMYLSIIEHHVAGLHPTVSDKLRSHLETCRFYESDNYSQTILTSCWSSYPPKYERPIVGKFFFP